MFAATPGALAESRDPGRSGDLLVGASRQFGFVQKRHGTIPSGRVACDGLTQSTSGSGTV